MPPWPFEFVSNIVNVLWYLYCKRNWTNKINAHTHKLNICTLFPSFSTPLPTSQIPTTLPSWKYTSPQYGMFKNLSRILHHPWTVLHINNQKVCQGVLEPRCHSRVPDCWGSHLQSISRVGRKSWDHFHSNIAIIRDNLSKGDCLSTNGFFHQP